MGAKLYHETDPTTGVVWLVFTDGGQPRRLAPAGEVGGLLPPGNSLQAQRKLREAAQCIREAAGALVPAVEAESPCDQPQVVDSELPPLPMSHGEMKDPHPDSNFYPVYTQEQLLRYAEEVRAPLLQKIKLKNTQLDLLCKQIQRMESEYNQICNLAESRKEECSRLQKRLDVEIAEAKGWKAQVEDLDQRLASKQREVDVLHHRWVEACQLNAELRAQLAVYKQAEHLGKLVEALNILKEPEA